MSLNTLEIPKAFVKRVDKTSVYSVEWAGKTQGKFSDKKIAKDFCDSFNIRMYGDGWIKVEYEE